MTDKEEKSGVKSSQDRKSPDKGAEELYYTDIQQARCKKEKEGIAKYVVSELIDSGKGVFLDTGSTVRAVATEIFSRKYPCSSPPSEQPKHSLTIMTNNMGIYHDFTTWQLDPILALTVVLILTGGVYDKDHGGLFGTQAAESLENFHPEVTVMGTSGLRFSSKKDGKDGGIYYHGHTPEEVVKKAIFDKPAFRRIIVCDYSKIGKWDSFLCGRIEDLLENTEEKCYIVTSEVPCESPDDEAKYYKAKFDKEYDKMIEFGDKNIPFKEKVRFIKVDTEGNIVNP